MTTYLTLAQLLETHRRVLKTSGGAPGCRDLGAAESALAQPQMTFGGQELYPEIADKASALGFSLIMNHPFVDGNKRVGHAAMETFLVLNGYELTESIDEQERIVLDLAASRICRDEFTDWVRNHLRKKSA